MKLDDRRRLKRIRAVADGRMINETYKLGPIAAVEQFKQDLRILCDQLENTK